MKFLQLTLLLLFVCIVEHLQAGSFIGGDIRYRHLSAKRYEVTVAVYRDCRGISLNSPPRTVVYNDSFEIVLSLTRVKIEEIKGAACAGGCITNTPSNQGDEKHTFLDTIDFSSGAYALFGTQARPLVYFAFEQCCRNSAITTYAPGNMFVDAMLNLYYANQNNARIGFNDFIVPAETYLSCMQTHNTSYRTEPYQSNDSLVYEMVRAKDSRTTEANYDPYKPLTYYCGNPNTFTCQSNTMLNPVRGFYFNTTNGNLMTTPANCAEVGTMVCRVSIYRRSGNTAILVGYMKRDYNFIVKPSPGERVPYIQKNRDYTIKAREQFCVDIPVKDDKDALQTLSDTVLITMIKSPVYGTLSLLDSNAREKTLHYCWTPTDADYLSRKTDDMFFYGDQKSCLIMKKHGLSTSVKFTVVAPDSLCSIRIRTYEDKNKNGKKDVSETYSPALVFAQRQAIYTPYNTDSAGSLIIQPLYGQFSIGIQEQLDIVAASKPVKLWTKFDSTYVVELGYVKRPGIKGRVYEDKNNNCVFDGNDVPLAQQNVVVSNLNRMAITDSKGYYFIQTVAGSVTLSLSDQSAYVASSCNSAYLLQMPKDSVIYNKDFAVRRRAQWTDLGIEINSQVHQPQGQFLAQEIKVSNNGFTTQRYVTVKLVSNRRLPEFKSNLTSYKVADTFLWVLDSIRPLSTRSLQFEVRLNKDTFKKDDVVCYTAWLRSDSVLLNNRFSICETIIDTVYQSRLKTSKNPLTVHDLQSRLCYQLAYKDDAANHSFLMIKDTLNDQIFDLKSLQIYTSTPGLKVNLLDNILMADYTGTIVAGTEIFVRFGLNVKTPFANSFQFSNRADSKVDDDTVKGTMTVVNTTQSAIIIQPLQDTVYCPGELIPISIMTRFAPERAYQCRILLSDSSSNFASAVVLKDTLIKVSASTVFARLPVTLSKGQGYRLKVVLPDLALSSFESDFRQTIQVHALPQAGISSNLRDGFICRGDTLKATAFGADSVMFFYNTYQVNTLSVNKTLNFVPSANGRLQVLVKDVNACTDSSDILQFKLHELPKVKITAVPEICYGDSVILKVSGANSFNLYRNSQFENLISFGDYQTRPLFVSSTYSVTGVDSHACVNSDSIRIVVNPLPIQPVIYAVSQYLYSSYGNGNQWYTETTKIDTAVNRYFYPPINGVYKVEYTSNKGCKAMSEPYHFKFYSIKDQQLLKQISVYPNPVSDVLNINNSSQSVCNITISSMDARIVQVGIAEPGLTSVDVSSLSSGVYQCLIETVHGSFATQIVVSR